MLEHLNPAPRKPARVVVIGAAGFVGNAVAARLERDGVPVLRVGRKEVNLAAPSAEQILKELIRPTDAVVAAAAKAPVKDSAMLVENVAMARALARASAGAAHVVNISSDAVYADFPDAISEASWAAPTTLHGVMHLARELVFRAELKAPLAILRPTLIYGAADPHNGYGPNRFRRLAAEGKEIVLFGEGEERRDHVHIDDVAELVVRVLYRKSTGVLNVATGSVHSFRSIAERFSKNIKTTARSGPMPHNGYRPFDPAATRAAFPDFRYTPLEEGLKRGKEIDLLRSLPKTARSVEKRQAAKTPEIVAEAKKFGQMYWDGPREYGYGGYRYDGRWRSVARDLIAHFGLKAGMRVLDVGCGKGFLVKDLMLELPGLEAFGLDVSHYALMHCPPEVVGRLHLGSADRLPFPDASFDCVISINTLHNLERAGVMRALREIQRLSGGKAYVQVDSYHTPEEKALFEKWVLTALFHDYPDAWRKLFAEAGYTGDYYWTIV